MVINLILLVKMLVKQSKSFGVAVLLLCSTTLLAAQIDVSVDRNPVAPNESFQVIFNAHKSPDDDPDFSPLNKDFDILNQQKSSQVSWINGKTNKAITWTLSLMAKGDGNITIPAISFGSDSSKPLNLSVSKTPASSNSSINDPLYLDVQVDNANPYVQSQVIYTVRLYQRVDFAQASLTELNLPNTVVEKLGENTQYNTQIKGITYRVTELKYALFPQESGEMTIEPMILTAQVIINDPYNRSFFNTQSTQTKRVASKSVSLNVQAVPSDFKGQHWLTGTNLSLEQSWSNNQRQVNVGEPITRTITITAQGTTASQLPDLSPISDPQLKVYPDQAVTKDQQGSDGITARREQKVAIIPSKPGIYTLPAIQIPWFNSKTNKVEVATLPATKVTAIGTGLVTKEADKAVAVAPTETPIDTTEKQSEPKTKTKTQSTGNHWVWLTLLFAAAWLITLILFLKKRNHKSDINSDGSGKQSGNTSPLKSKDIMKNLEQACNENDPKLAQSALLEWARATYQISTMTELEAYADPVLQAELINLNQALYAKDKISWEGALLLQAVMNNQANKQAKPTDSESKLAPLYPSDR